MNRRTLSSFYAGRSAMISNGATRRSDTFSIMFPTFSAVETPMRMWSPRGELSAPFALAWSCEKNSAANLWG